MESLVLGIRKLSYEIKQKRLSNANATTNMWENWKAVAKFLHVLHVAELSSQETCYVNSLIKKINS